MMDIISDSLARINNSCLIGKSSVKIKNSKIVRSILNVMQDEGFISGFENNDQELIVGLKYDSRGVPVIRGLKRMSKSSRRLYIKSKDLKSLRKNKFALSVISTSMGVMSDVSAYSKGIGGELICEVC